MVGKLITAGYGKRQLAIFLSTATRRPMLISDQDIARNHDFRDSAMEAHFGIIGAQCENNHIQRPMRVNNGG